MILREKPVYFVIVGIGLVLYLALLVSASKAIKPWNDEAMSADAAYNLSTQGHTGVSFFDEKSPLFPGISRHSYYIFPLQLCVLAVWYKIVGFSLLSTRVISVLWTLLILTALYWMLKLLTRDRALAALAAVATALDYHMMTEAAFGRYDTMVAGLGFSSYAIYLYLRERNFRWALILSNCCTLAAGATHPNGLLFFIGLWFLVFYFDRKRIGWIDLCLCAVPYLIGAAVWASFILQDLPAFKGQLSMNAGGRVGLLHPWDTLIREIQVRYITEFGLGAHSAGHYSALVRLKAVSLAAYLIGVIGCLLTPSIRRRPGFKVVLFLIGIHWFYMTFYENMKFSFYLVHLLPLYCAAWAAFVLYLWRAGHVPKLILAGALTGIALIEVGGILAKIRINDFATSYMPAVEFVRQHASDSDQVNASCSFGFGYGFDRNLLDDNSLGYYNHKKPEYVVAEEIYDYWWQERRTVQPDVYRYCMETLKAYDLIYNKANYKVYQLRHTST